MIVRIRGANIVGMSNSIVMLLHILLLKKEERSYDGN